MNSFSDITVFALVAAINLFLCGGLLAGGLAVVLRFTENVSPRLRYLASVAIFLAAIFIPFAAPALKNSVGQKVLISFTRPELKQKNKNVGSVRLYSDSIDNIAEPNLSPVSGKSTDDFLGDFISTLAKSVVGKLFLSIWGLGVVLLLSRQTLGVWRLKKSREFWAQASEFEKKSLHCPKNASLYFAGDQRPGTVGWLRPSIVLPKEFPAEISLESKRFILRHELSHARWRDPLAGFLLRTVRNIFWISPALWLIEHLIYAEREAAADRAAISILAENRNSQATALNYAETLLSIAQAFKSIERQKRQPQPVGIGAESDLEIRIRRLLSSRRTTRRQLVSAICACFLTVVTMALIPVASFSEVVQETHFENDFFADGRERLFTAENSDVSLFVTDSITLPATEYVEGLDKSKQSKALSRKLTGETSPSIDEMPKPQPRENRTDHFDSDFGSRGDKATISDRELSDEDAAEADLRENQRAAERLSDLEPLPASRGLSGELNALQKIQPASELRTLLPDKDEVARRKAASELDRRQIYQANYPKPAIAVPKRETYEPRYIPYSARRGEQ